MDKRTCCGKSWIKNTWKVSSFHFIFQSILFYVTLVLLRNLLSTTTYEKMGWMFCSSSGYLWTCKKPMWSSHSIKRYMWWKNPAISLVESLSSYNSRTRISHQRIASHTWLIHEFYYLMCFFNLILKLCLCCRENIPFLLLFCFLSRFQKQPQ